MSRRTLTWIFGICALIWWISCIKNGIEFYRLAVALGATLAWFISLALEADRTVRRMTSKEDDE
jgi:hypothetical protein